MRVGDALCVSPDAYALCFRSERRTVIVLWATHDGIPVATEASRDVRRIRLVALDGSETAIAGRRVELTLGPSPVYVVFEEGSR